MKKKKAITKSIKIVITISIENKRLKIVIVIIMKSIITIIIKDIKNQIETANGNKDIKMKRIFITIIITITI